MIRGITPRTGRSGGSGKSGRSGASRSARNAGDVSAGSAPSSDQVSRKTDPSQRLGPWQMPLVELNIRSSELGFPTELVPDRIAIGVDRATNAPKYVIFTGNDLIRSWFPSLVTTYDEAPSDIEWAWYGDQSPRRWFKGLRMTTSTWGEPGGESTIDLYIDRKRRRILVTLQHGRRGSAVQPRATYSGNYHPGDLGLP